MIVFLDLMPFILIQIIQGKGNYRKLILEIRKHLNLNLKSIETNYDLYY